VNGIMKILLAFLAIFIADLANAQGGCSDAGVCTLGGHSTLEEDTAREGGLGLVQTYGFTKEYSYLETIPSLSYDFKVLKAELSLLYRISSARYDVHEAVVSEIVLDPKRPTTQHVTVTTNRVPDHYALGDAKLSLSIPIRFVDDRLKLNLAYTQPLTKLYTDRPQEMQSTLGVPGLLVGGSFDDGDRSLSYGGTLAYQTTFSKQNDLHLVRADDIALALRLRGSVSDASKLGADISAIYHTGDDLLHDVATSNIQGYESTKGLTLNLGGSFTHDVSEQLTLGLYAAAPIVGIAHVDGLKRSFVSGLIVTYGL
jgi:hypothetical protein